MTFQVSNDFTPWDQARIALYFAAEDETFGAFKAWAQAHAIDQPGLEWAESLTVESVRVAALTLHGLKSHGITSPSDADTVG